jgi:methylated-DNA-[protein]-cysteine S-methyltransferase
MNFDNLKKLQNLLLKIPKGKVTTYKEIARAMDTKGYRYIGQLLGKNPEPDRYPCYKVVCSNGSLGGYSGGIKNKVQRLRNDGIVIKSGKVFNLASVLFKFNE